MILLQLKFSYQKISRKFKIKFIIYLDRWIDGHTRRTCPSIHIHQGGHVDSDNSHEFMEQPASGAPVGSPNLQTNYVGDI